MLIIAIALPGWVQYARTVRGSTMVERNKEYVQAARVIGVPPLRIMLQARAAQRAGAGARAVDDPGRHRDPRPRRRCRSSASACSPTSPSLGTFINEGNKQLFSGAWWLIIFPGAMLVLIALSMNLFGDWLRDALNPRLR